MRAGRYGSRPSHLDPLHVDVRFGAREVIVDAGTFAYNGAPPWRNALVSALVHNGPVLDAREPGIRGPRFLWYLWPAADILRADRDGDDIVIIATVPDGIRRTVRLSARQVRIDDEVPAGIADEVEVRWLLHPEASTACVRVEGPSEVRHATEGELAGWYSPMYGLRLPARVVIATRAARHGVMITSLATPRPLTPAARA